MAILLTSSTPSNGATDYFINKSVELTFDKDIATTSLTENVFSLIDIAAGTSLPITITASPSSAATVVLQPSTSLKEDTEYRVIIVGTTMGLGYSLVAADDDALTATLTVEFATGGTVYKIDTTVEKEAASLSLEGELFLPTNVKALGYDFTVSKVRPKNNKHSIPVTLTGDNTIRFTFSKSLYTGSVDFTDWADVSTFPLLNTTDYLASGETMGAGTIPGYTVSVTGADLLVAFDSDLPKNLGIQVELYDDILSIDGESYGGAMQYSINTALYPEVYGIQTIKREVREIVDTFTEDYIGALLFKNTLWSWEKVGRSFDINNPSFAAKQFITYSTILDLMEDREYYKYVVAGTRRQLGDLNVSIDNIIGRIAMKVAKYQKAKDNAFEALVAGWQFKVGGNTLGYTEIANTINRLWHNVNGRYTDTRYSYNQGDIPASNISLNRGARTNNPIW
tara:strand:+ start:67186 stop:68541 length:1356 start_codon:yes stop_codon:yes gene_type:complete